jgi:hypothetical protein
MELMSRHAHIGSEVYGNGPPNDIESSANYQYRDSRLTMAYTA